LNQGLNGLPAANISFIIAQLSPGAQGGSSEWQSYTTGPSAGIPDAQATTESATVGDFVDNGDGTYQYTFAQALTAYPAGPAFDAGKTHRLGVEIRTSSDDFLPENIPANNAPYDFVPTSGTPLLTRLIVDNNRGLGARGGRTRKHSDGPDTRYQTLRRGSVPVRPGLQLPDRCRGRIAPGIATASAALGRYC
jgi:hypothetical protein